MLTLWESRLQLPILYLESCRNLNYGFTFSEHCYYFEHQGGSIENSKQALLGWNGAYIISVPFSPGTPDDKSLCTIAIYIHKRIPPSDCHHPRLLFFCVCELDVALVSGRGFLPHVLFICLAHGLYTGVSVKNVFKCVKSMV